jgi:hypothetical protein
MASTAASFAKTYDSLPQLSGTGDMVEIVAAVVC